MNNTNELKPGGIARVANDDHAECCGIRKGMIVELGEPAYSGFRHVSMPAYWNPISGPGRKRSFMLRDECLESFNPQRDAVDRHAVEKDQVVWAWCPYGQDSPAIPTQIAFYGLLPYSGFKGVRVGDEVLEEFTGEARFALTREALIACEVQRLARRRDELQREINGLVELLDCPHTVIPDAPNKLVSGHPGASLFSQNP